MKYKIFIIIIIGIILTTIIYFTTYQKTTTLLSLGDSIPLGINSYNIKSYNFNDYLKENLNINNYYNYSETDETTKNLLTKIENNTKINNKNIKQIIKQANYITISIGMDELNNYALKSNLTNSKIQEYLIYYEQIIKNIRKINNNSIYLISLYKTKSISTNQITKINNKLKELSTTYQLTFIDITNITNYISNQNNYHFNYQGHKYIYNQIINF